MKSPKKFGPAINPTDVTNRIRPRFSTIFNAKIYGTTTYGKGYMQRIISLSDGSGIKLSIAKYNPPYGENYEVIGVSPDVSVEDKAETESDEQLEKAKNYFIK